MNIETLINDYKEGKYSVEEVIRTTLDKIKNDDLNAYISIDEEGAIKRARELDEKLKNNEEVGKLFGLPIAVKDNISYDQMKMTCGSKMLEDFKPVYNATVIENLLKEDAIIVAKTNMDEFAMGSRGKTSYFGPTKNPLDKERVTGGSSSGSAAAVASGDFLVSLGTDTGGSVRGPAAFCNIVGYKPTYGLMSRYGVVSMANSLDQVSLFAKDIKDVRELSSVVSSPDEKDMTSILELYDFSSEDYDFAGKKIGIIDIDSAIYDTIDETVKEDYKKALSVLKYLGADLVDVDFKYLKYANNIYNVVMSSEVSSNMSRFDGLRFGHQADSYESVEEMFTRSRSEGFGEEVQRRIALGTVYLSANDDQRIYKQGLKIRALIKKELEDLLSDLDLLVTPTNISLPPRLDDDYDDPLSDFISDGFNVIVNLAGMCGISLPVREGISGSVQFIANRFDDKKLLNAGERFLRSINEN
ncbi:Asp-tRNA(Asn)/Glu-tRNA(Gln) amidotransferase subunit GatA [Anaerococcus sp. AGMB09787]|uniref:Asp-tRNA(Asn)/Glu-tRNA(Gln) amidotransferase subunit GatA n=1 Tax=Anaerococcus sp. AGMB09787 TaxID=2922869 RepID=UPI001FAFA967|nr:Asp-tRNA(Asn)/Glu-tRNA(Gln) amidotransferase subunit GatA [Anaerococcus sp. AGMB09787]